MNIPYREITHGSLDEEWAPHHKANDWWYLTGYLRSVTRPDCLYSYQFTIINPRHFGKAFYVLHLAFTDMQTGQHFLERRKRITGKKTGITGENVAFLPYGLLERNRNGMMLNARVKEVELTLNLKPGKDAVWHGNNGVMVMGTPEDPQQRTVYYSFTNMPTSGSVKLTDGSGQRQEFEVTGKSWFDRQWGPFRLLSVVSFWEWFSIRFFDDEEVMLFAFPQHSYYEGTFIDKTGKSRRITDYKYDYHKLNNRCKLLFSYGWDVTLPGIKDERYRIVPMNERQFNGRYYEMMASVSGMDGTEVGYCFVELLPGVRQDARTYNLLNLILIH